MTFEAICKGIIESVQALAQKMEVVNQHAQGIAGPTCSISDKMAKKSSKYAPSGLTGLLASKASKRDTATYRILLTSDGPLTASCSNPTLVVVSAFKRQDGREYDTCTLYWYTARLHQHNVETQLYCRGHLPV